MIGRGERERRAPLSGMRRILPVRRAVRATEPAHARVRDAALSAVRADLPGGTMRRELVVECTMHDCEWSSSESAIAADLALEHVEHMDQAHPFAFGYVARIRVTTLTTLSRR